MTPTVRSNTDVTEKSVSPSSAASGRPIDVHLSRQYLASPYVNDRGDNWDMGLGYDDSERETIPRSGMKRDLVIDLPKLRQLKDSDAVYPPSEPAIIWNAKVYQIRGEPRGDDIRLQRPDLTYVDDRPIEFSIGLPPTKAPAETDDDVLEPEAWTGPVITIETFVEAEIDQYKLLRLKRLPERVTSSCLDLLNPKHVSRRHLVVESPYLVEGLSELVQYYPSFHHILLDDSKRGELRIKEPFAVLFHHFDAIAAMANGSTRTTDYNTEGKSMGQQNHLTVLHAKYLMEFLEPIYTDSILTCQKHLSNSVPQVEFGMIWYLLKPGIDVYVQIEGSTHAAVVRSVRRTDVSVSKLWGAGSDGSWLVDLWRLESDGSRLRKGFFSVTISPYSGLRDVTRLQVCPVSIWDAHDGGERRERILRRAAIFFKALQRGNLLVDYKGPIQETAQYYTGKVVIDHRRGQAESNISPPLSLPVKEYSDRFREYDGILINNDRSFYTTQGTQNRPANQKSRPDNSNDAVVNQERLQVWLDDVPEHLSPKAFRAEAGDPVVQQLTEHQLLLLCPDVLAYGLRRKHWMLISLDYVQESVPSDESISNLIIAQDELKTIQALSNRQNSEIRHWTADFIEGKGSGQIILLHGISPQYEIILAMFSADNLVLGPPGVGKTYTVEAISEWLHRPLLALTVADIGTVETLVEGELMKWFDLAEAWNAVLLVDEADIFLERRQNRDLARNGLVSAFLRRMEYFKGLLFLTTNRVGQIDDAFISRVHVAIGYQALDEETRRKVWSGFFRKLVRERAGKVQIAPDAKKWVLETAGETNLNGRDIRNALQTAITLAEFESEEDPDYDTALVTVVTKAHFQKVLEMCNRFRSYVTSIRREDEMKRAQGRGDRNDYGNGFDSRMC
ncbi:TOB3 (member of AAA-ATPase family) [Fusarium fujikuroi]|nr:TOB3 (member of AAA-ATPase family) [Fusarium fujikuroi]